MFLKINDKDLIGREPLQNYFAWSNPHTKTIIIKRCWGSVEGIIEKYDNTSLWNAQGHSTITVSYTHLTLPTILLV